MSQEHNRNSSPQQLPNISPVLERPEDFLSPQQRADAIAEILATIAVRIIRKRHETPPTN